jgi:putative dehydrogenase
MNTPKSQSSVGVIGLGAMGGGMAQSVRRAGFVPYVFDVRADVAKVFANDGGTACASLAELGKHCDVVVSVVVNAAQTESVLFGQDGCAASMKPGSVFIMCSTVDPNWSVALEARLAALGILYIDAPISGGAAKAASGQMTMMTAGKPEAYAIAEPLSLIHI